ncbi:hypothetical protein BED43_08155 [Citrobacter freundii]|nr:hypothetical protein CUC48_02840 [Citrobacter freundii]OIY04008.1 hypothetical protein BED43_08155 [Citrobacter freundii]OIZ48199.1 hypothetical protein BEH74_10010 [Citrobacter freundii]
MFSMNGMLYTLKGVVGKTGNSHIMSLSRFLLKNGTDKEILKRMLNKNFQKVLYFSENNEHGQVVG